MNHCVTDLDTNKKVFESQNSIFHQFFSQLPGRPQLINSLVSDASKPWLFTSKLAVYTMPSLLAVILPLSWLGGTSTCMMSARVDYLHADMGGAITTE